ncbi:MAG: leucyl aminopeptidase [Planctomycetes bacterium]|nr:leucyl aminopeptidase [Planctomycetota bacterium]
MQLTSHIGDLHEVEADWLILPIWEDGAPGKAAAELDVKLGGVIARLREAGDIKGKAKELTPLLDPKGIAAGRVMVVGLGKRAGIDRNILHDAAAAAARAITSKARDRLGFALPEDVSNLNWGDVALACGVGLMQGCDGPGLRKSEKDRFPPKEIVLIAPASAPAEEIKQATERAGIEAAAVSLARELVNTPPCDLFPETFAARADKVAQETGLQCTILDLRQLETERMGALLAVARGSARAPRLVVLRHSKGTGKTLGLVGKGVTFDSGGLSLKTNDQMVDMKCDMAGAAAVLGAMQAIARMALPVNVIGVMALVENMPGGKAMKLGDVLHARNGKTIEVLNTDAEGRLILADALAYAIDHKADHLVDLATLTGACIVALGMEVAGLMSNNDEWKGRVETAARTAGERLWPLPMFPLYGEMIKSDVADIKNTGGSRWAGAISAAKFLEEFVAGKPWVHLDIAGPAWAEKENAVRASGGTGAFVRTLVQLARQYA